MACWSRVFSGGNTSYGTGCCNTGCFNQTSPDEGSTKPTIFGDIPVSVSSIAEGVGYWAEQLRQRLAATATITSTSDQIYTVVLRRGTRTDSTTWQVSNAQGAYPVVVSYATPVDSGSNVQFQSMHHCIDWLVEKLA